MGESRLVEGWVDSAKLKEFTKAMSYTKTGKYFYIEVGNNEKYGELFVFKCKKCADQHEEKVDQKVRILIMEVDK
jgi:hypothetical protein